MPVVFDVMFVGVLVALIIPALTRGSYGRLTEGWRVFPLLAAGFALQAALGYFSIPAERWHDLGFGTLVASYVLVLGFCAGNLLKRGMGVVIIGVACNALAIVANQGMPVDVPADWARSGGIETTVKHHPQGSGDRLTALGDIIVLREPTETALSFGDLIMVAGLIDVSYHASRRRRSRRTRSAHKTGSPTSPAARRPAEYLPLAQHEPPPGAAGLLASPAQAARRVIDLSTYDLPTRRGERELALAVRRHPANGLQSSASDGSRRAF